MILEAPIFHFEDPPAVSGGSSVDRVNSGIEDNCEKSCLKPSITMPSPVLLGSAAMQIRCDFCKRHAQGNFFMRIVNVVVPLKSTEGPGDELP